MGRIWDPYATGLRRAKVTAEEAMRMSHHASWDVHQKYVREDGPIPAPPTAALPRLGTGCANSEQDNSQNTGKTAGLLPGAAAHDAAVPPAPQIAHLDSFERPLFEAELQTARCVAADIVRLSLRPPAG